MTYDIITIGSATRDVFLKAEGFELQKHSDSPTGQELCFPLGSKIEVKQITFTTGGGGTNTAATFARQGLKTACVGVVGNDAAGQEIIAELKKEEVEPFFQIHNDDQTAYSVILTLPNAERTILSYKGEGQHFDVNQIPFDKLKADWLYLDSLGGHYDLFEKVVNWAIKNNTKLATNPGGKELTHGLEKLKPLLKNFSVVIMNQEEAARFSGIDYQSENEIFKFMDEIIDGIFVMTKGHEGAVISDGVNVYRAGTPDSPIIERTGAGDAFSSGFVTKLIQENQPKAEGWEPKTVIAAIQFATANASSVVTKVGAKAGILQKGNLGPWPLVPVETHSFN